MFADRLTTTVQAVLDVLAGVPLEKAAAGADLEPADLAAATAVYQQAGQQALARQAGPPAWQQLYLHFTDWNTAEQTVADHLLPVLDRAQADGRITGWWFIRKNPCWRLRLLPSTPTEQTPPAITDALNNLASADTIRAWWPGTYEPETAAFGGTTSMTIAHTLFHADSHAVLTTPRGALGRRELSVLLCSTLMRAAALEWYEQGDAWHRVTRDRPLPDGTDPDKIHHLARTLTPLLTADTNPASPLLQSDRTLRPATAWVAAFRNAGTALGTAARDGTLERGLRDVIAYHVIFHWNRLGLAAHTQSVLAHAARTAILHPTEEAVP
ncbi:thiopeptide-type bacteriocin biosynthesis protein [Streptomyces sp. NPDC059786]|uniref:thiopeptide-type bacteriocin biosynthesis protein n=1 Tax=Streptomyces sp. NPDC059786 TaxID=3346946 RepID=UPI00364B1CCD